MALTRINQAQVFNDEWKQPVNLATTADVGNLYLGNAQPNTVDGVSTFNGARILVKSQTDATQNGIWDVVSVGTGSNGWWIRTTDASSNLFIKSGMTVVSTQGNTYAGQEFRLVTPDPITLNSTNLSFQLVAGIPGGGNTQIQFNDSNYLSGSPVFTYNKVSNVVTISSQLTASNITVGNLSATNTLYANSATTSTSTTTGAIVVPTGGLGVAGNVYATAFHGNLGGGSTTTDVYITGNLIPSANVTYNLGSPTNKFHSAYFSGNTIYLGSESAGVSADGQGTWNFTSNGSVVQLGSAVPFNPPSANIAGNVYAGAVYSGIIGNTGTTLFGTLQTAAQTNITSVGTLINLNVTGNVLATNLTGLLTTASQTAITQVGTLVGLNVSGNVTTNILNAPLVYANTYVSAGAVYAPTIGNTGATLVGTLSTAAQTNITSVGSLTSLNVLNNATIGGNLTVTGTITTLGNVNNITITGNSGQFFGNTNGFGALYAGIGVGYTFEPQTILQLSANYNGYAQLNLQNTNGGPAASGDLVVTMDTGNTNQGYIDLGINSSGFTGGAGNELNYPGDGYLYVQGNVGGLGGNLLLSTNTPADIVFAVNGQGSANEIGRFVNANKSFKVTGNINVTGNILSTVTNTGFLNSTGNVLGVAGNFGSINTTGNILSAGAVVNALTVNGTTTLAGTLTVSSGFINSSGNILATGGVFNSLTVNGGITSTGYFNTTANISTAQLNAGQINTTGNVLAVSFVGSGSLLTALPGYAYSNVNIAAYTQTMGYTNYSNVNLAAYLAGSITTGAITATGAINTSANVSAATVIAGQINTTGNVLSTGAVHNTLTVNGTASTNVASVASTILAGAVGVTGNIIANASVIYGNTSGGYGVRQFFNPITNSLDTVFG